MLTGTPLRPEHVLAERLPGWLRPVLIAGGAGWRAANRLAMVGAARGIAISDDVPAADELDLLADTVATESRWVGTRDHRFHVWRFHEGPRFRYRVRYARVGGELAGYVAARLADFEGLRACVIIDCITSGPREHRVARALLADTFRWATDERADLLAALSFGDGRLTRALRRFPLLRVPRRFVPQQAPVLAEWTRSEPIDAPPELSLTLADMDVF